MLKFHTIEAGKNKKKQKECESKKGEEKRDGVALYIGKQEDSLKKEMKILGLLPDGQSFLSPAGF